MDDTGGAAPLTNTYAFAFTGSEQVGTTRVIHDFSSATSSFSSGGNMNIQTRYSATGGNPISVELFLTFTWDGDSGGTVTKSVEYAIPNSGNGNTAATTAQVQQNLPLRLSFPEIATKTLRSAYVQTEVISSDTTSPVNVNAGFNQNALTAGGVGFLTNTNTGEGMSFYYLEAATSSVSVASTSQVLTYNAIVDASAVLTSKAIVTYDVAFTGSTVTDQDRQIKTVEYSFGNSSVATSTVGATFYATDVGFGTTSAWGTSTPGAASNGFNFQLHGSNINIVDAWIEFRAITASNTSYSVSNIAMGLSTCAVSCGSAPVYQALPLLGLPATVFHTIQTGEHNIIYARADATAALHSFSSDQWQNGIENILRVAPVSPVIVNQTAKLFITYESDYSTTAHTEVKTVRFPLNATSTGDSGSRSSALAAGTAQAFEYLANIPDAVADSNILDVHFELHAQVSHGSTNGSMTAGIIGGSTSPEYPTVSVLADTSDQFVIYKPPIDSTNFQRNTTQYLNVTPTRNALNVVGGELVVTYKYSTNATSQTETVKYMVGQSATSNSTASSTYVINPVISNAGATVQNIYVRAGAPNTAAATLHLRGDIDDTGGASPLTNSYSMVLTGAEQIGTNRIILDMSDSASSFVSGGPMNIQSRYQASGGDPVSLELFITFTWNGNLGGPITKSVEYSLGNSRHGNTVSGTADVQHEYPMRLRFPETNYTKTLRDAHVKTEIVSGDATTPVNINADINQGTIASGGTGFLGYINTGEAMSFYFLESATSSVSVASTTDILAYNIIADSGNSHTAKAVVTYDVGYAINLGASTTILLSGSLFSDEGSTAITSGKTIGVVIGTTTPSVYATTSTGAGTWNRTVVVYENYYSTSTPIVVYVDADATTRATLATLSGATGDISGLDLYQNRFMVTHEGTTSPSVALLSRYDADNDSDLQYTAATTTNTLTVKAGNKLYIKEGKTFAPSGNITINGSSTASSTIDGSFLISSGATYTAGGVTSIAGNLNASSSGTFNHNGYTTRFTATTTGKVINATNTPLGNVYFAGSNGGWSFAGTNATTSNLFINTNATVTAPSGVLTVEGDYVNGGGFLNSNGTVRFASTSSQSIIGLNSTSSPFSSVLVSGALVDIPAEQQQLTMATDTSEVTVGHNEILIDEANRILYAGSESTGSVYRCALSTLCDGAVDFTAVSTGATNIESLVIDVQNGHLYLGGIDGLLYRCALTTGCDATSDFALATDTGATLITSLAIDYASGTLYAGSNPAGVLFRCQLSTSCDSATDFTVATDTASTDIGFLAVDSQNGVLYAGGDTNGFIYRCVLATGCDSATDFTVATDTLSSTFRSSKVDTQNNALYVAVSQSFFYRCAFSTGCDSAGDFTVINISGDVDINGFDIDQDTGILYVASGYPVAIFTCNLGTGCDSANEFQKRIEGNEFSDIVLAVDKFTGFLYTGNLSGFAMINYCILCNIATSTITNTQNLTIESGATLANNTETRISGNYTNNGTSTFAAGSEVVFTGSSAQGISGTLTATSSFAKATFIGAGTKTFNNQASTTDTFTIGSGATVIAPSLLTTGDFNNQGSFTAPANTLYAEGDMTNTGTFSHNNGTTSFEVLGATVSGTFTNTSGFNHVIASSSVSEVFAVASTTIIPYVESLVVDGNNDVLYVGLGNGGARASIYRCTLSTNCDSETDFTLATTTGADNMSSMLIDEVNNTLYIGSSFSGLIRCALSTGCDNGADFTVATSGVAFQEFAIDTANNVLYLGGINGSILRCALSTGCDNGADFTTSYATGESSVQSLIVDSTNGVLYVGTGFNGIIFRCELSTGCTSAGHYSVAATTYSSEIFSLAIDSTNGVLYAGANGATLYRCVLSTNCDSVIDFTTALEDWNVIEIYSVIVDTESRTLYAGSVNSNVIYRCALNTGCNNNNHFTVATTTSGSSFAIDSTNGVLYAGAGQRLIRRSSDTTFTGPASTTNIMVSSSRRLNITGQSFSISGNYINNGTLISSTTATTTFNGTSGQELYGNMTASSSLGNVVFRGAGTKTITSNASTTGNFRIETGSGSVVAPTQLTIAGNYSNDATFTAGSGTTTFSGTRAQSATGTMTGTSAFNNLVVTNGSATTTFGAPLTVSGHFTASTSNARLAFVANGISTFNTVNIIGTLGNEVKIRSTADGTQQTFVVTGAYLINYVDVKDSNACGSTGGVVVPTNAVDSGNTTCWNFAGGGDSSPVMFLTGTLYTDEGVTPLTVPATLAMAIGTSTPSLHATTTNASGAFSFGLPSSHEVATSTPIVIWVNDNPTTTAVHFTKASSTQSISGLDLYRNRIIISHEATTSTSTRITDMAFYDTDQDADIRYSAATTTNTLTVFSNNKVFIREGKTFAPGGSVVVRGNALASSTDGTLHLASSSQYIAGGNTTLAGYFIASSSGFAPNGYTLNFNATTTGKYMYATTTLGNVYVSGDGATYSFAHTNATTTNLFINTNATVTAPTGALAVEGDLVNGGGFIHNSGTVRIVSSTQLNLSGNFATSSAFSSVTVDGVGAQIIENLSKIATTTAASEITTLVIDSVNRVLYAGSNLSGIIYRCALSTGCDEGGDFTTATDTQASDVYSLAIDTSGGVLYAGTGSGGIIYRCALSTGCDSTSDFTTAVDTAAVLIFSLAVDQTNGVLYAGSGAGGIIYRCALSTGCDSGGDFTTATDTGSFYIPSLTIDAINGVLYAGSGDGDGVIYQCVLSTGCSTTNFTTAFDTGSLSILSLTIDAINGVLYAGSGYGDGVIYRCALSTNCDTSGDFTTAFDTDFSDIYSLAIDTAANVLYVGTNAGTLYRCSLFTNCDASSDYAIATDTPESYVKAVAVESETGVLYAGSFPDGVIYRCTVCHIASQSVTSLTNLTVNTNATLANNTETRISGNYTNSGTSTFAEGSEVVFTGSSAQAITGTLTATSSFTKATFIGAGTKTFNNQASTTDTFTIGSASTVIAPSLLTVGAFNNQGSFTAPGNTLYVEGDMTNSGTFSHNNGTTSFEVLGATVSGTFTGASALRNLFVGTGINGSDFILATATENVTGSFIDALEVDIVNGVLYVGKSFSDVGEIYRCVLSTGCDSSADFTVATNTAGDGVNDFEFDYASGTLYATGASGGHVFRCVLSTGCDSSADFTSPVSTASGANYKVSIDTQNRVLYIGGDAGLARCALSTGCDASGDFTVATSTGFAILGQEIDATNNVLYLVGGTFGSGGFVVRCALSTGCDASGDFTVATSTYDDIEDVGIDSERAVLYMLKSGESALMRCALITACDQSSEYTSVSVQVGLGLGLDTINEILYIAGFNANTSEYKTYTCSLETDCDSNSDFSLSTTTSVFIYTFGFDPIYGVMYAGGSDSDLGRIYRRSSDVILTTQATTTNLTIGTNKRFNIGSQSVSVSGNYSNNGTFIATTSGTTTFNGTSQQTATGTMTGASAFGNLVIANTSGYGSSSQSVLFGAPASTTGNFVMLASTSAQFAAGATSTFQNISLQGTSTQLVWLRSSAPGSAYGFYTPGEQHQVSYVDVQDNYACPITISASSSTDSGNNLCWSFGALSTVGVSSDADRIFEYNQATTSIGTITVTDTGTITAANDIRIKISTTTVRMLWDTTDTTATFGGTASGKVSNPVSYEGGGSILVVPVDSNFSNGDTLTISGLSFAQFTDVNPATSSLALRTAGVGTTTVSDDDKTTTIKGLATLSDHVSGQVSDNFDFPSASDVELFAYRLAPLGETMNIGTTTFSLLGVNATGESSFTNIRLYRDINSNLVYDASDVQIGGVGDITLDGQTGTIAFTTAYTATTTRDYLLVVDTSDLNTTNAVTVRLDPEDLVTTGNTSLALVIPTGSASYIQHIKGSGGGGGSASAIGGAAPAGDGVRTGGGEGGGDADPDSGDSIGNEPGFNAPSSNSGSFTNGGNAYSSDGSYASAASTLTHTYGAYGFVVPEANTIEGIEVKLEGSATTNAGTLSARLSWNNGSSYTSLKTTQTVSTTDAVYTLGGPSDTWGHTWTPAETANGVFLLELTGTPSGNTVRLDALQVKIYHQATGGGGGGGGAVFKKPDTYYANVYSAVGSEIKRVLEEVLTWLRR